VVSENVHKIQEIRSDMHTCIPLVPFQYETVHLEAVDLVTFLHGVVNTFSRSRFFDFIEYNGGISIDSKYKHHLELFHKVLTPTGVIGLTYFTKNIHEKSIKSQVNSRNLTHFIPFSIEKKRFILQYLRFHNLDFVLDDKQLLIFLGTEPLERQIPPKSASEVISSVNWVAFRKDEVSEVLSSMDFSPVSWIPTAYTNPYRKLL
jgi:hypothetical protein